MPSLVNLVRRRADRNLAGTPQVTSRNPVQIEIALQALIVADIMGGLIGAAYALHVLALDFLTLPVIVALPYMMIPLCGSIGVFLFGGYQKTYSASIIKPLLRASAGAGFGLGALAMLIASTSGTLAPYTPGLVLTWGLISTFHFLFLLTLNRLYTARRFLQKIVLIGATPHAEKLIADNSRGGPYEILGVFDDRASSRPTSGDRSAVPDQPLLGKIDDLLTWQHLPDVDQIVITVTSKATERIKLLIDRLRVLPQEIILLIDLDSFTGEPASGLVNLAASPAAYVSGRPVNLRQRILKRAADIVLSLGLIVLFSPVMLVCALLIKLEDGGPVLFRQQRHGFRNELIRIWKLRSMRPDPDAEHRIASQTRANDPRITRIGKFIRRTSLDELPQLFNVLMGEMSLVGPRPHAVGMTAEATLVNEIVMEYSHRHRVKPGITGWAQINGSRGPVHSHEDLRDRVRLDIEYLNSASFLFDIYILLMTAPALLGDRQKVR